MSKFLHRDAAPGAGDSAERIGLRWPELPWTCPRCGMVKQTHAETVATVQVPWGPVEVLHATFFCVPCDLSLFMSGHGEKDPGIA